MDPVTMMLIGTGLEIAGRWGANIQQSIAEKANAQFYRDQEKFNIQAMLKDVQAAEREAGFRTGTIRTTFGASGVDVGTGSAVTNLAASIADGIAEIEYLKNKGELDIKLARMRGNQSQNAADTLGSTGYNLLQAGTTLLSNSPSLMGSSEKVKTGNPPVKSYMSGASASPKAQDNRNYLMNFE